MSNHLCSALGAAAFVCLVGGGIAATGTPRQANPPAQNDRDVQVFTAVCIKCHPRERIVSVGRTRSQWEEVINQMIHTRGAQISADDFETVLNYLTRNFSPEKVGVAAPPTMTGATPPGSPAGCPDQASLGKGGGMLAGAGPSNKPLVDAAAADRGRTTWASECINCHGTQARGTEKGPNLVRSLVVLADRCGSELKPFLIKGHPLQSGKPAGSLADAQVAELAHFLRQRVNDGLRGSPIFVPQNILTGDAKAGAAFFNGEGKCTSCHSGAGNLSGIGARLQPIDIQQRFLFPATGRGRGGGGRGAVVANANAVRVTVTPPNGSPVSGVLVTLDDFFVSLRQDDGTQRTIRRVSGMKVDRQDPLAYHVELLDRLTDRNMHDVVAYLETLK